MHSLILFSLLAAADIHWQPDYPAALELAASEGRVVFLAVNMDGERANDRLAEEVYASREIIALSEHTVNLIASAFPHSEWDRRCSRFAGLTCSQHRSVDRVAREKVLVPDRDGAVVAPQHVFLKPGGEVILSVPYEINTQELEWCFVTAILALDPGADVKLPKDARPPKRLILAGVHDGSSGASPATREEVLEAIATLKKGRVGRQQKLEVMRRIVTSAEPEALSFVETQLRDAGGRVGGGAGARQQDIREPLIRTMGQVSPEVYGDVLSEQLKNSVDAIRTEAAVALEQIGSSRALKVLKAALGKEKEPEVRASMLRALGSVGSADAAARKLLLKEAVKEKDEIMRANALVATGLLVAGDDLRSLLTEALGRETSRDRAAALIAIAFQRDPGWIELLEGLEPDQDTADVLEAALAVLRGGSLAPLAAPLRSVTNDRIPRLRYFGRAAQADK